MPVEQFANLATTTVTSGGTTAPSAGTPETWTVASSSGFPAANSGATPPAQFHVADSASGKNGEIIAVTLVSGTTWTVTRGAESTTPVAHAAGFTVYNDLTAGGLSGMLQSANNLSDVASASAARTSLGAAPLASPALTGTPTAPTASALTDNTQLATTAYADSAVAVEKSRALTAEAAAQAAAEAASLPAGGGTLTGSLAVEGALGTVPVTLTDAATITVNAALSDYFRVTLGGSRTLGTPSNPADGQQILLEVIQPASGGPWTLSYSGAYSFPASVPQPVLSTAANDHDFISFAYNASLTAWTCTGYVSAQNSGLVTIAQGGTGQTTAAAGYNALSPMTTTGDIEYESGTSTAARLAGNTSATKNFLTQTGTGSVSAAPAWGTIAGADLPYDSTAAHILLDGNQAAGANARPADSGHVHPANGVIPADHGLLAWSVDIDACINGFLLVAGTVYLVKIPIRYALTATYLWFSLTAAGSGASTGSYVGLYSSSGTLLTGSSDLGTSIAGGNHQVTLTTPQSLAGGSFVWAAIVTNQASTQPTLRSPLTYSGATTPNLNLSAALSRAAIPAGGTTQTALPGSFTPSSNTTGTSALLWFGIS